MIVVLGSRFDPSVRSFVDANRTSGVHLCDAADLSHPGWQLDSSQPTDGSLVVEGRRCPTHDVAGVLTARSSIAEWELLHMSPNDRAYAAAEMTAFLLAWLAAMQCPVVNRPTPSSLNGPAWCQTVWLARARSLGIPVRSPGANLDPQRIRKVTVLDNESVDGDESEATDHARTLARLADVLLLSAIFEEGANGPQLISATTMPHLNTEPTSAAIMRLLSMPAGLGPTQCP